MSRVRERPTREETRQRLYEAAAEVFVEHGVSAATIERICAAAGFTRGAFYSNFTTKDELVVAMLDEHLARSRAANHTLLESHRDPESFVRAMRTDRERDGDPLHSNPVLQVELMLYVARIPALRPIVGHHIQTMRSLVGDLATRALEARGIELDVDAEQIGIILVALEDGLRLHRLVDPESTPTDAFFDALDALTRITTGTDGR